MKNIIPLRKTIFNLVLMLCISANLIASSHREAPLISNDPLADNVDLYAFRSPDNPDMITIIATYVPLQLPHGGPNYYSFGENIRYEIHVDNDATIAGDEITYRFTFNMINEDPTTFFNIRLGSQNQKTTYNLERSLDGGNTWELIVNNGIVPPNNIGKRSIEGAAGLNTSYSSLFQNAINQASTGETVFAGPTDDPFFVDLGGIFDLGDAPRQDGNPVDALACFNVSAIAIQIPISTLLKSSASSTPADILDPDYVIGVWASASRPAITTLSATADPTYSGDWVQVSRLGMPLTNEAVIPIGAKDFWNAITPYDEIAETTLDAYFYNPELALYMDDDLFGAAVPGFSPLRIQTNSLGAFDFSNGADGLFSLKGSPAVAGTALDDAIFGTLLLPGAGQPRSVDLWPAFHTGVPNFPPYQLATGKDGNPLAAGKPFVNNFLPNGGDMLRLNMAVPATPRDDPNFSSLGLIQAAAIGLTVAPFNTTADLEFIPNMDGFPNGRRLEDDVTRIELQAVSGVVLAAIGLWYDDYDPASSASPVTQDLLDVLTYTTGVETNDRPFTGSFPYLAMPHDGAKNCSGEIQQVDEETISQIFVSSNTSGLVGVYDVLDNATLQYTDFPSQNTDADGIFYDEDLDVLYQLNRSDNRIDAYGQVANSISEGQNPPLIASSSSDFINGREIAVSNSKLVVAQDANSANGNQNRLIVYDLSPTAISLSAIYDVDINLWGIHLNSNNLWAIEDNSNRVVVFNNLFDLPEGLISPDQSIEVSGLVRTHGLTYVANQDLMLLTDIGAASSPDDGAILIISNFSNAAADGIIEMNEQIRIEGPATSLGNPVDIAWDPEIETIFVAERANGGGRLLGFSAPDLSGDFAPVYNNPFAGASAVNIPAEDFIPPTGADISIEISANSLLYEQYEHVTYTIKVVNDGPEATTNVSVAAGLPDGMVYSDDDPSKGDYSLFFEKWTVGDLESGETATLVLDLFTLVEDVDISNFVQVLSSDSSDPDSTPGNDQDNTPDEDDEASLTLTPAADGGTGGGNGSSDLELSISTDASQYEQYDYVVYTISLTNNGPDNNSAIVIDVPKPDGLAYSDDDPSTGDYSLFFETWEIESLASGETAVLTLTLFNKVENVNIDLFVQVRSSFQPDPDSTPGNDIDQSPDEDDEALASITTLNFGVANSNSATSSIESSVFINKIFPVPTDDILQVQLQSEATQFSGLFIYNVTGSVVQEESLSLEKGLNNYTIDVRKLAKGIYFLKVPESDFVTKFVKSEK